MGSEIFQKGDLRHLISGESRRFVALREGRILFESDKRGIAPLYGFIGEWGEETAGAWIGDTVVGRGGALLLVKARAGYLYAGMISEGACKILEKADIPFDFSRCVPGILNRDKTGSCPVERLTAEMDDPEEAWTAVGRFLRDLQA